MGSEPARLVARALGLLPQPVAPINPGVTLNLMPDEHGNVSFEEIYRQSWSSLWSPSH